MRHEDVGELIEYLFWARNRILTASAALTESEFRSEATVTTRSLRGHTRAPDRIRMGRRIRLSAGSFPEGDLVPTDFATLDAVVGR
jgi:hypothetical protein